MEETKFTKVSNTQRRTHKDKHNTTIHPTVQRPDLRGNHHVSQKKRIRKPISAWNRVVRPTTFGYLSPTDGTRIGRDLVF